MNAWSHLPNAQHIDWVIQSLKDNPDEWAAAWDLAWDLAWDEAMVATVYAIRGTARDVAGDLALDLAGDLALDLARNAAWGAILALIAYDNSAKYLDMTYEELKVWATISEDPASILLLPMVKAKELIEAKNEQALV